MTTISIHGVQLPLLTGDPKTWIGAHLISVKQITPEGLSLLFDRATKLAQNDSSFDVHPKTVVATVFYEASTRTACSFQAAAVKLSGNFMHVDSKHSSSKKGESLSDTLACLACYADAIVLRHPSTGIMYDVLKQGGDLIQKPLINAGDGTAEHPTQALLDVYTIRDELKHCGENITLICLGDLKHGRTVHSLVQLISTTAESIVWKGTLTISYVAPEGLEMPDSVQQTITQANPSVKQYTYQSLDDALKNSSENVVLYVTRIQRERFDSDRDYEAVKGSYVIDRDLMDKYDKIRMVLHPLPRVDEISTDVDRDPRAAYFRQMQNGLYVRMGILSLILQQQT